MKKIIFILIIILLFWRFRYSMTRYFDIDEFAHLHWGYSYFIGEVPYRDFFYLFPPFFLWTLWPLFYLLGRQVLTVVAARLLMFVFFLILCFILYLFSKKLRNKETALFSVFILTFLPMPMDKLLEIRPDLPALIMALSGLYFFVLSGENLNRRNLFICGLFMGISLGFVPKTIFFLAGVLMIIIYQYFSFVIKGKLKSFFRNYLPFAYGIIIPILIITLFSISRGKAGFAFYSMTRMAADVTKVLASKFYISPNFYFYPNDVFYGKGNISPYYSANLIIWFTAIIMMIRRLISFFSYRNYGKRVAEFIFAVTFFVNLAAYVKIFPLKHAQYLIPLAPFVAFYSADFWFDLLKNIRKNWGGILTLGVTLYLAAMFKEIYDIRIWWNNRSSFDKINYFLSAFPGRTAIFDLTGESVFFPNGYYFCCIPYGQYNEVFDFSMPDIKQTMERRKTEIVHLGTADRIGVLPNSQAEYIKENFSSVTHPEILIRTKKL